MTERIQELAKQAGIWQPTFDHKTWVRGEYVASLGELEKFAELIVKECATRIESHAQELRKLCRNEVSWANKELYEERIETCDDLVWQISKLFENE